MAEKTVKTDTGEKTESKAVDYIAQIGGNFNLHNATAIFGGATAVKALQAYAQFGGHGVFDEAEFRSSLFGGLGAPAANDTARRTAINDALNKLA